MFRTLAIVISFIVAVLGAFICGHLFTSHPVEFQEFSRTWYIGYALFVILMAVGLYEVRQGSSVSGTFGNFDTWIGLAALCAAAFIFRGMFPAESTKEIDAFFRPYSPKYATKPHLQELLSTPYNPPIAGTVDPGELSWVKMAFPTSAKLVPSPASGATPLEKQAIYVQIKMSKEEAEVGFPVLKSTLDRTGNVIGSYMEESGKESRTDDL